MESSGEEDWEQVSLHSKPGTTSPRCESPYLVNHPGHLLGQLAGGAGASSTAAAGDAPEDATSHIPASARSDMSGSWHAAAFRTPSPVSMAHPAADPASAADAAAADTAASEDTPLLQHAALDDDASQQDEEAGDEEETEGTEETEEEEAETTEPAAMIELRQAPPRAQRSCFWRLFMSIPLLPVTVVLSLSLLVVTTSLIVHHQKVKASAPSPRAGATTSTTAARAQAVY